MSKPTHHELGWEVLAQPTGEVLTAEARSPGLLLGLLGVPRGFDARDAEGWLYDVAGVSHESSASRPATRPIPPILDHALTGLLFSHAELWDHPECATPCSFAFVEGRGEIGFGWVGEAKVSVWVDGEPRDSGFVTLRDSRGRQGKAWSIPSYHNVQVRISWRSTQPDAGGAEVEASWIADGRSAPGYHPVPVHTEWAAVHQGTPTPDADRDAAEPAEADADAVAHAGVEAHAEVEDLEPVLLVSEPAAAEPAAAPPRRRRGFGAWLAGLFGWFRADQDDDDLSEDEVWRIAAEEPAIIMATGTDDAIGFPTPVAPGTATEAQRPALRLTELQPSAFSRGELALVEPETVEAPGIDADSAAGSWAASRSFPDDVAERDVERSDLELIESPEPPAPVEQPPADAPPAPDEASAPEPPIDEPAPVEPDASFDDAPETGAPPSHELVEAPVLEPLADTQADADLESIPAIPPTPEPAELTERTVEWIPPDDPNAIDLPSLEPAARLARIEASLREHAPGLELVGVLPEGEEPVPEFEPTTRLGAPARDAVESPLPSEPASGTEDVTGTAPPDETAIASVSQVADAANTNPPTAAAPVQDSEPPSQPAAAPLPPAWAAIAPQHPAWPTRQELERTSRPPILRHLWGWIAALLVLFGGGWLLGSLQDDGHPRDASHRGPLAQALHVIGLSGPRYEVQVSSRPPGAWISVDGQSLALRTPAAIEAKPGRHVVSLTFPDYGSASFPVVGGKGQHVPLDAPLWGALEIISPDEVGVIAVSVDGVARGAAPVRIDSLAPGVHEIRFSAPGVEPWGQTVEIKVRETHALLARAVSSPSSGVLEVQASMTDEAGTQPLKGAQVWIDGEARGVTPLVVDLPRGPHSVRIHYKNEEPPIQVIDLPGGNQRFAVFELGLDRDAPRIALDVPARIPRDRPAVISANLAGVAPGDVREMWLHVRMPEGAWRRYAMTVLKASAGVAGVATFPTAAFDAQGRSRYYVSVQSGQGDETFTELRSISLETSAR